MTTLDNNECRRRFVSAGLPIPPVHNETLCGFKGSHQHGACTGDSGSPMVFEGRVIGFTSWGVDCNSGANGEVPHAFTRVSIYIGWITNKMEKLL